MEMPEQVRNYIQPNKLSGRQLVLSTSDKWVGAVLASLFLSAWIAYGFLAAVGASMVISAIFWRRRNALGRNYYVFAMMFVLTKNIWSSGKQRPPPYPYQVNVIRDMEGDELLTLVHTPRRNTDTIMVFGDGSRQASLDLMSQEQFYDGLTMAIKRASLAKGYSVGISTVFSRRPQTLTRMLEFEAANIHPGCFAAPGDTRPLDELSRDERRLRKVGANLLQVYDRALEYGSDVEMSMGITIKRTGALARIKSNDSLQHSDSRQLPVLKLARNVATDLNNLGVSGAHVGDYREVLTFLKGATDIINLGAYKELLADIAPGLKPTDGLLQSLSPAAQKSITRTKLSCEIDGTHHSVIRLTSLPTPVLANTMAQLYASSIKWIRITVVGESVRGRPEEILSGVARGVLEGADEWIGRVQQSRRSKARRDQLEQSENSAYESGWVVTYNVMIAVSIEDIKMLEELVQTAISETNNATSDAQQIVGLAYQLNAMYSATTGISVL